MSDCFVAFHETCEVRVYTAFGTFIEAYKDNARFVFPYVPEFFTRMDNQTSKVATEKIRDLMAGGAKLVVSDAVRKKNGTLKLTLAVARAGCPDLTMKLDSFPVCTPPSNSNRI